MTNIFSGFPSAILRYGDEQHHIVQPLRGTALESSRAIFSRHTQPFSQGGVPGLMVEADMTDARAYDQERVRSKVQTFREALKARGGHQQGQVQ